MNLGVDLWRELLSVALAHVRNLDRRSCDRIAREYAPKLSQVADSESPAQSEQTYTALCHNIESLPVLMGWQGKSRVSEGVALVLNTLALVAKLTTVGKDE